LFPYFYFSIITINSQNLFFEKSLIKTENLIFLKKLKNNFFFGNEGGKFLGFAQKSSILIFKKNKIKKLTIFREKNESLFSSLFAI
jgi:hypothetical protein